MEGRANGNVLRGEVEVAIGGELRTLRLTQGDLVYLNERFDRGTWALVDALQDLDHRVLVACLHRALYHGAPSSKQQPSEEDLAQESWVALEVADAVNRCIWRSIAGRDPEEFLKENPELAQKAAEQVGRAGPPEPSGEGSGETPSSSVADSDCDPGSSGSSPPTSLH